MTPQGSAPDAARALAAYLANLVDAGPPTADWVVAIAPAEGDGDAMPAVFERYGEVALAAEPPPSGPVGAVAISAPGHAVRLDRTTEIQLGVQVTVAVTCCTTAAIVRHDDGRLEHSDRSDGVLLDLLRAWAQPAPCRSCSTGCPPWAA